MLRACVHNDWHVAHLSQGLHWHMAGELRNGKYGYTHRDVQAQLYQRVAQSMPGMKPRADDWRASKVWRVNVYVRADPCNQRSGSSAAKRAYYRAAESDMCDKDARELAKVQEILDTTLRLDNDLSDTAIAQLATRHARLLAGLPINRRIGRECDDEIRCRVVLLGSSKRLRDHSSHSQRDAEVAQAEATLSADRVSRARTRSVQESAVTEVRKWILKQLRKMQECGAIDCPLLKVCPYVYVRYDMDRTYARWI